MRTLLLSAFCLAFSVPTQAQSAATYRVTFDAEWSVATHPDGFPPNPHFSWLVGATHREAASLWEPGGLASPGIEAMAETGATDALLAEVDGLRAAGTADRRLSGDFLALSPGTVSMTFDVRASHPLVSLVTMIAPSPDWFVGVHGLDLFAGGAWADELTVDLLAYDAGTDSGPGYTSPDQDTSPAEPIRLIESAPFFEGDEPVRIGTFTFSLLTSTSTEAAPDTDAFALSHPVPNPAAASARVVLDVGTAQPARVEVFDLLGRRALLLHDGPLPAGRQTFRVDAAGLAPGAYVVRARGASGTVTRRLTVAR
jgi:hypothetical protein